MSGGRVLPSVDYTNPGNMDALKRAKVALLPPSELGNLFLGSAKRQIVQRPELLEALAAKAGIPAARLVE